MFINLAQIKGGQQLATDLQTVRQDFDNRPFRYTEMVTVSGTFTGATLKRTPTAEPVTMNIRGLVYNEGESFTVNRSTRVLTWTALDLTVTDVWCTSLTVTYRTADQADHLPTRVLTDNLYKMHEVYPNTYASMTAVPDALDTSALTTTEDMFTADWDDVNSTTVYTSREEAEADAAALRVHLVTAPALDTSGVLNMSGMFGLNSNFGTVTDPMTGLPTSLTDVGACTDLTTVPEYDTSSARYLTGMFMYCTSLPSVFPWVIQADSVLTDDEALADTSVSNNTSGLANIFAWSSVEEVTFVYDDPSTTPQAWAAARTVTLANLDMAGTLTQITIYNLPKAQRTTAGYTAATPYIIT